MEPKFTYEMLANSLQTMKEYDFLTDDVTVEGTMVPCRITGIGVENGGIVLYVKPVPYVDGTEGISHESSRL